MPRHRVKKTKASEADIRAYEVLTPVELANAVTTLGNEETAELISSLLKSYRTAANVANSAWQAVEHSNSNNVQSKYWAELKAALAIYSTHFTPSSNQLEYGALILEMVYNDVVGKESSVEILDVLFNRLAELYEMKRVSANATGAG